MTLLESVPIELVRLQVANGDQQLLQHITEGPLNAQYTSKVSAVALLDAIDTWLFKRLTDSLKSSTYFSVLADECQDISTAEELSICCRWIVNGKPDEHFLTVLHITSANAATISHEIRSFLESTKLNYIKLVGQAYDGAATFAGHRNGVQKRIRMKAAHAMHIHCACHRLQLEVPQIKKVFGIMTNLWKIFFYSPKKAEKLISHERCIRAISKDLPALIITLQQLYDASGDAVCTLLASCVGVACVMLLSEVLDGLAQLKA